MAPDLDRPEGQDLVGIAAGDLRRRLRRAAGETSPGGGPLCILGGTSRIFDGNCNWLTGTCCFGASSCGLIAASEGRCRGRTGPPAARPPDPARPRTGSARAGPARPSAPGPRRPRSRCPAPAAAAPAAGAAHRPARARPPPRRRPRLRRPRSPCGRRAFSSVGHRAVRPPLQASPARHAEEPEEQPPAVGREIERRWRQPAVPEPLAAVPVPAAAQVEAPREQALGAEAAGWRLPAPRPLPAFPSRGSAAPPASRHLRARPAPSGHRRAAAPSVAARSPRGRSCRQRPSPAAPTPPSARRARAAAACAGFPAASPPPDGSCSCSAGRRSPAVSGAARTAPAGRRQGKPCSSRHGASASARRGKPPPETAPGIAGSARSFRWPALHRPLPQGYPSKGRFTIVTPAAGRAARHPSDASPPPPPSPAPADRAR